MKTIVFYQHGESEVLQFHQMDTPTPSYKEALIQVKAVALNHLDIWVRKGWAGLSLQMPHILGSDISGIVADVKNEQDRSWIGQEIIVSPGIGCGKCEYCYAGNENYCDRYIIFGENIRGGYSEYLTVPVHNLLLKPKHLSFDEAAAFPLTFLTAYHMLKTRAKIQYGETVLIHGASSGVGVASIQLAKLFGAKVIASTGSEVKTKKAYELGADFVINYAKEDIVKRTMEITQKKGVDLVVEHVGEKTWQASMRVLKKGARIVICGATTGYQVPLDLRYIFFKQYSILGSTMGGIFEFAKVVELFRDQKLKAVIDNVLPLTQAKEAHDYLEQGKQFGKVVLIP